MACCKAVAPSPRPGLGECTCRGSHYIDELVETMLLCLQCVGGQIGLVLQADGRGIADGAVPICPRSSWFVPTS